VSDSVSDSESAAVAGWYPDPLQPGAERWWDGTAWSTATRLIAAPAVETGSPAPITSGVDSIWIWLVVLVPVLNLLRLPLMDIGGYVQAVFEATRYGRGSGQIAAVLTTWGPRFLLSSALGVVTYGLTVLFGALDWLRLRRLGVDRPFHWAWGFLWSLVYVIGRAVVIRRRTGKLSPTLWISIAVVIVVIAVSIAFTFAAVLGALQGITPIPPSGIGS
jgi:Protein of unknown function (DUF2510)